MTHTSIAILGFGVVGSGTAEVLTENKALLEARVGTSFDIKAILDLRDFPGSPFASLVVHDFKQIVGDPDISIVAEMMGGSHPAYEFTKACLAAGKSVVTSNKEVVANFGVELLEIARAHGVSYLFEASVGGGIPIIRPMKNDLAANKILSVSGILNGTTNYILTRMKNDGASFEDALKEAQKLGYAEANPAADVEGLDAARKIVILAAMAYGISINPADIFAEGITRLTAADTRLAEKLNCALKLIGYTERKDGRVLAMVSPRLVPLSGPIASVDDVFNGILVDTDMLGQTMFYGRGAGKLPTASAVVADIADCMKQNGAVDLPVWKTAGADDLLPLGEYVCRSVLLFAGDDADLGKIDASAADKVIVGDGRIALVMPEMSEKDAEAFAAGISLPFLGRLRFLA